MLPGLPAALGVLLSAAPAVEKLAIVDVDAIPSMMGLGAQVTQTVIKEAQAQKKKVLLPEDVRKALGNKPYDDLVKCGDRAACVGNLAGVLGVDRVVVGHLSRDERNYLVKLWLFDVKKTELVADVDRAILIASRRFLRDVTEAAPDFLRGKREAKGTVVVTATAKDCSVTINGEPAGKTPLTVNLKPGRYEVKIEKKAYLPVVRLMDVEANQTRTEEVRMLVIPGQVPDDEKVPELARRADKTDAATGPGPRPLTFVAGGLTLAAVGLGLGFGVSSQTLERNLLVGYDPVTDTYQGTRQQALDAQTNATVANVAWISAGALGALTIVSIILDATQGAAPPATVAFTVSGDGAGLVVGGTF
jgi:PEGA domain